MNRRNSYFLIILFCFCVGAYVWKIVNTGKYANRSEILEGDLNKKMSSKAVIFHVGETPITREEIDWEYELHTKDLENKDDLTPIPETSIPLNNLLSPLKERIVGGVIERKLLYQFIRQDSNFSLSDSSRYVDCMNEWQHALKLGGDFVNGQGEAQRLKNRLCEKSILLQYVDERIFSQITVSNEEVTEYFNNHRNEFVKPDRVIIRQIVLASEKEAKKVRSKIKHRRFSSYAREVSITPEAANGGRLGPFAKGEMPRVFDVAFSMRTGEVRGILKSTYGFHIIKLEKKLKGVTLGVDQARKEIEKIIVEKKKAEEYQKWVELALNAIPVTSPEPFW